MGMEWACRGGRPAPLLASGFGRAPAVQPVQPQVPWRSCPDARQAGSSAAASQQWRLERRRQHERRRTRPAAKTQAAEETDWASYEDEHLGPAAKATLDLLDWGRLCSQVAAFAQTTLGQRATAALLPLPSQPAAERALQETAAVDALESQFAADLDFGGIQTAQLCSQLGAGIALIHMPSCRFGFLLQCGQALARASRGGLLSGAGLQAVSSLLLGAAKLQRAIKVAAREAEATGYLGLAPVTSTFKDIATFPELAGAIGSAVEESGSVRESASEDVRRARGRVRTIEGRLRGILKGHHGEITEQGSRLCVAVPASPDGPPKGILLGSGPGGSTWYVEPPAAVPLNNDLAAPPGRPCLLMNS